MAEVLSQNQIDMLLAAMNSGDDSEKTKSKENLPEMRYRKYDFYSPKKFTKDKLRLLQDVFDKYTRIVVSQAKEIKQYQRLLVQAFPDCALLFMRKLFIQF